MSIRLYISIIVLCLLTPSVYAAFELTPVFEMNGAASETSGMELVEQLTNIMKAAGPDAPEVSALQPLSAAQSILVAQLDKALDWAFVLTAERPADDTVALVAEEIYFVFLSFVGSAVSSETSARLKQEILDFVRPFKSRERDSCMLLLLGPEEETIH